MSPRFVHLHLHSEYSLTDSSIRIPELVSRCAALGLPAVAVTDTNNMFAALEFSVTAQGAGVQPIVGCQVSVAHDPANPGERPRPPAPVVLLAEGFGLALPQAVALPQDFHLPLTMGGASPQQAEIALVCSGWWTADTGRHTCFFAETTPLEASRRTAVAFCQRLELAFEHLPVMVAYHGPGASGRCLFANRRYAELFGLDPQAIIGMPARQILGNTRMREVLREARSRLERGVSVVQPCDLRKRDGTWMRLEVSMVPGKDRESGRQGTFVLMMDITERYAAERALRESEVRLSKFMEATAEGLVFHDDGIITDINPVACDMLGRQPEQLKGRQFMDFLTPDNRAYSDEKSPAGKTDYHTLGACWDILAAGGLSL